MVLHRELTEQKVLAYTLCVRRKVSHRTCGFPRECHHRCITGEWALHCQRSDDLIEIHCRDTETVCRFLYTLQSTGEDGQDGCHSPGVDIKIYWIDNVQIDFITNGSEPVSERSVHELGWNPVSLHEGIVKYLEMRPIG